MRIVSLSPGTGSYHCGTCMRDNALIRELRRQGHEALMVPLYLPLTLDEEPAADPAAPPAFGGINCYLQQKLAFFRRSPQWLDRLFNAPWLLRAAAKRAGMTSPKELGELTLSMARGEQGNQAKEGERLAEWLANEFKPDVVLYSTAMLLGMAREVKQRTGAVALCFLNGEDSFLDSLPDGYRQETWAELSRRAREVDALLPVSRFYGDLMAERLQLSSGRVRVVYPGISLEGYAPAAAPPSTPVLGYLARMSAIKGLDALIEAFLLLRARNRIPGLKLRVGGSCTSGDELHVAELKARLAAKGLAEEVEFHPNLDRDEKIRFLQGLSALSVPATYGEAFGLYAIEALAAGVPLVQPRHGAFPEIIEATGGGVLFDPGDPVAHAEAVEGLLREPAGARAMGERGRSAVLQRFDVTRMAEEVLAAVPTAAR